MAKKTRQTNRQFATDNQQFVKACDKADVEPTKRQASKWRRKTGKAYQRGR